VVGNAPSWAVGMIDIMYTAVTLALL